MSSTLPPADQSPPADARGGAAFQLPAAAPAQRDFSNLVVAPAIQRSLDAFRAALPELLKNKTASQQWVAFSGAELVTFGRTKTEAAQECFRRGLQRGMFIVRSVEPEGTDEVEIMWDDFEIVNRWV